ncbi:EamA family transporter [Candidatus Berkiella aquae]|uniref:DMT family transporter n=1 Tax=Candidatus Berkiella aquae TaxID=295108 RepID=A0A0Q9YVL4_9GAMM|nr:DMT family transporter [Candidatus Berkiella aquae]MCS5710066.1 DMT family transporter [Candidatus Berkiella aquae]
MNQYSAYALLALAQAAIAVNVVVGKFVIEAQMPIFVFLGVRFLISSVFLSVLMVLGRISLISPTHPTRRLEKRDWIFLLGQAMTGGFLFNYLFFWGIESTTATSAGIISSTLPAFLAIAAFIVLQEKFTRLKVFGIILAILGIIVINLDNGTDPDAVTGSFFGDFLVLLAILPEALYSIFNKCISHRVTPLGSACVVNWMIFLLILPLCLGSLENVDMSAFPDHYWGLIAIGSLCGAFFYWAWGKGLQIIPASTAAIFGGVLPVVISLLGYFFLNEIFGWYDLCGMLLVFASIATGVERKPRKKIAVKNIGHSYEL